MKRLVILVVFCYFQAGCVPWVAVKFPGARGRVFDNRNGSPIAGAMVTVPGAVVKTDRAGRYDLPRTKSLTLILPLPMEFGAAEMVVSHPDYVEEKVRVDFRWDHKQYDVPLQRLRGVKNPADERMHYLQEHRQFWDIEF